MVMAIQGNAWFIKVVLTAHLDCFIPCIHSSIHYIISLKIHVIVIDFLSSISYCIICSSSLTIVVGVSFKVVLYMFESMQADRPSLLIRVFTRSLIHISYLIINTKPTNLIEQSSCRCSSSLKYSPSRVDYNKGWILKVNGDCRMPE
jgi:hypothetical protein